MKNAEADTFSLDIFEGPLGFLLHLIQKSEIQISDVQIHEITHQYLERIKEVMSLSVDNGAEFIGTAAYLMWMKSKKLLPKHEEDEEEEEDLDPTFEIIHKLLEYCQFKEVAKVLTQKEHEQYNFFKRGVHSLPERPKVLGIEHVSLEDLAELLEKTILKAKDQKGKIHEEEWRVSDKIVSVRSLVQREKKIPFSKLFTHEKSKNELIVTFLAMLELMKIGDILIGREVETNEVMIYDANNE